MRKKSLLTTFIIVCTAAALTINGCGTSRTDVVNAYDLYNYTDEYLSYGESGNSDTGVSLFASDLCVGGVDNTESDLIDDETATAAAVFTLNDGEVTYAKNIYEKRYPASTTKILTALLALEYGDLNQILTVSDEAITSLDPASSVCGLHVGDRISLSEALYGLMLCSGNDAANVIAEAIGGSQDAFAEMMNKKAADLGCTGSHFVNPHGLPDENHYTTAYDLYLIFNAAIEDQNFVNIISTDTHEASYTDSNGAAVNATWSNSDQYITGIQNVPDGITVIGGKTGTTQDAGYCLVLYSLNSSGDNVISIVMGGDNRKDMYDLMSGLLVNFTN